LVGTITKANKLFFEPANPEVLFELLDKKRKMEGYFAISGKKTNSEDFFLYHKTTNRKVYDETHRKAIEYGYMDVVFVNEKEEITEGCISNIFIKKNGKLITPPMKCGLLNGTMRQYILKSAKNAFEEIITIEDLKNAEEIYLCNSIMGIVRVKFDNKTII